MLSRLSLQLGLRLVSFGLWKQSAPRLSKFLAWTAVMSLMLGIASLVMITSVMNGFDQKLRDRLLSMLPHMVVSGSSVNLAGSAVRAVTPYLELDGMLVNAEQRYVRVQGVSTKDPIREEILRHGVLDGHWPSDSPDAREIVLGVGLVRSAGLRLGDQVRLLLPTLREGVLRPKWAQFELVGAFALGAELDYTTAITSVGQIRQLLDQTHNFRVTLTHPADVDKVKRQLTSVEILTSWDEEYESFFAAVKMEKIMMVSLLGLLVLLALMSLSSSLQLLLVEKLNTASVLHALGLSSGQIRFIFIVYGVVLGSIALAIGAVLGIAVSYALPDLMAWVKSVSGFSMIEGSYFVELPVDVRVFDVVVILLSSFLACLLISLSASRPLLRYDLMRHLR